MASSLIINSNPTEVRVAVLENGSPVELHVERRADRGVVGNIYRGRVVRVLPGMQAAFVDIGIDRTGFLYVNDALPRPPAMLSGEEMSAPMSAPTIAPAGHDALGDTGETELPSATGNHSRRGFRQAPMANISDLLKSGQDILVQVQKE